MKTRISEGIKQQKPFPSLTISIFVPSVVRGFEIPNRNVKLISS